MWNGLLPGRGQLLHPSNRGHPCSTTATKPLPHKPNTSICTPEGLLLQRKKACHHTSRCERPKVGLKSVCWQWRWRMITEVLLQGCPTCGRTEDILQQRNVEMCRKARLSSWAAAAQGGQWLEPHKMRDHPRGVISHQAIITLLEVSEKNSQFGYRGSMTGTEWWASCYRLVSAGSKAGSTVGTSVCHPAQNFGQMNYFSALINSTDCFPVDLNGTVVTESCRLWMGYSSCNELLEELCSPQALPILMVLHLSQKEITLQCLDLSTVAPTHSIGSLWPFWLVYLFILMRNGLV